MDELDQKLLFELQKGLQVSVEPFNEIAKKTQMTPTEVLERIKRLQESGVIRRFGVCMKPLDLGLFANALVAWKIPEDRAQEVGVYLSGIKEITHCYKRKPIEGKWPYNIYTVMHASEREKIEQMAADISKDIHVAEYAVLFSVRDLKKTAALQVKSPVSPTNYQENKQGDRS